MAKGGKLQGMDDFVKTGKLSGISFIYNRSCLYI